MFSLDRKQTPKKKEEMEEIKISKKTLHIIFNSEPARRDFRIRKRQFSQKLFASSLGFMESLERKGVIPKMKPLFRRFGGLPARFVTIFLIFWTQPTIKRRTPINAIQHSFVLCILPLGQITKKERKKRCVHVCLLFYYSTFGPSSRVLYPLTVK